MKKILAIILVVAMTLVPVAAMAATVTTTTTLTLTEVNKTGGSYTYYSQGTTTAVAKAYLMSDSNYSIKVTAPTGYYVSDVEFDTNSDASTPVYTSIKANVDSVNGGYILGAPLSNYTYIRVTYVANAYKVVGAVIGASQQVISGFGSVSGSSTATSGYLTMTASVKNAYFTGDWWVGNSSAALAEQLVDEGTNLNVTSTSGYAYVSAVSGYTITVNLAAIADDYYNTNAAVYVGAQAIQAGATIIADVATYCQGYGTVSVTWLSSTSAKVTATAKSGCKFVGWKVSTDPLVLAALADLDLNYDSNVLYLTDIDTDTQVEFIAYFIVTSGNFTTGTSDATGGASDNPKTGDTSNVALWTIVGIIALGGVAVAAKKVFAK